MSDTELLRRPAARCVLVGLLAMCMAIVALRLPLVVAQEPTSPSAELPAARAPSDLDDTDPGSDAAAPPAADQAAAREPQVKGINLISLIFKGGFLMVPIGIMSLLVVAIVVERFIALRRSKVLPEELVAGLGRLGGPGGGFDPRDAYRLCQQFPSSAATVIRAMLLKVGRPHSEVEHTVAEASQREAERIYANVRWLNLAAGVSPLLGLLGTVWGMIRAFHDTTQLLPGQNKADYLAEGIYVALVTTLAGLSVAIPAAIFAHVFEGRIQNLFHQIDELLFNLLPQIERYEGRMRFGRQHGEAESPAEPGPLAAAATTK
ncbi:MAG: MotA/TolQ/ExbB proton channel family protein [Pirellulaceae bacterium]|nr:MotA/TolQ/ExbB proton channel family protein [Pirellulaceae bacterium]